MNHEFIEALDELEKDISKLYCNKKQYFNEFKENRHGKVFVKTVDKLKRGRVRVTVIEKVEEFKI